jgi:putative transposase
MHYESGAGRSRPSPDTWDATARPSGARHGPEFIAYAVADWCRFNGTGTIFIDPGSPWQNAWIESFNGRMRDEHLNGQQFDSLLEAKSQTEDWRIDYNMNRPHSAHGWLTPVEFVEAWLHRQAHQLA